MEAIKRFLSISSGDGSGYGSGYGYGDGYGYGYGDGSGYGSGDGYGVKTFGEHVVCMIDNVATIITRVMGNLAKGFILNDDLTLSPCFVVKGQNLFAHGETVKAAQAALQEKIFERMDTDEKIDTFLNTLKLGKKYPAKTFYEWHHKLTGSCEMGRNSFCARHNIDLANGMYTVEEFIEITESDYGGEIIKRIKERIN